MWLAACTNNLYRALQNPVHSALNLAIATFLERYWLSNWGACWEKDWKKDWEKDWEKDAIVALIHARA
jgi:hypothetical protein